MWWYSKVEERLDSDPIGERDRDRSLELEFDRRGIGSYRDREVRVWVFRGGIVPFCPLLGCPSSFPLCGNYPSKVVAVSQVTDYLFLALEESRTGHHVLPILDPRVRRFGEEEKKKTWCCDVEPHLIVASLHLQATQMCNVQHTRGVGPLWRCPEPCVNTRLGLYHM